MKYRLQHEGQESELPEEVAADETKLRRALATIIPGIAEAKITSSEEGDVKTFTVTKVAGTKGADPLAYLTACAGGKNAVIACYESLETFDFVQATAAEQVQIEQQIETALHVGGTQRDELRKALKRLNQAEPKPAPWVAAGF